MTWTRRMLLLVCTAAIAGCTVLLVRGPGSASYHGRQIDIPGDSNSLHQTDISLKP